MADAQGNRYGPYDIEVAGSEAEAFTETAWHDAMAFLSGVVSGADLTFAGLTATLSATPSVPLHVWSHGGYIIRTDPWSIASPATATGGNPRRDMIVARRQRTSGVGVGAVPGKTVLTLLQGTPAATPADPTPDSDDDEPLWSWQVPGNAGTAVPAIRDLRRPLSGAVVSGAIVGSAPPFGTPLIEKTMYIGNAQSGAGGDNTYFFPGGAFPHGVVSIQMQAITSLPYTWNPWNVALDRVNARLFSGTSAVLNTACPLLITVKGW